MAPFLICDKAMPITQQQLVAAQAAQQHAARDGSQQVRLVAGPGTGKSFSIEERVCWLLGQQVAANAIIVISFTRASANDLRLRIHSACANRGLANGAQVRVSTLHSLALRMLRAAGMLQQYPVDPLVLDNYELETIFDAEFGHVQHIGKRRREAIRIDREGYWSTGVWNLPNHVPPDPAITEDERQNFIVFHGPRTQTYSCILPGEIVRQCLDNIIAGALDPLSLVHMQHLIVDEYQDLNPVDQQFVEQLIARGVITFVAGDDDQSIYSMRYASPEGIQAFTQQHPQASSHTLIDCFRCASAIVDASNALMVAYAAPNRIPKTLNSLYAASAPPLAGTMMRWRFRSALAEADAIASSCNALVASGVNPRDILILLSYQREQLPAIENALNEQNVPFESPRSQGFIDVEYGRLVLALVRIICDSDDYVAHRLVLGLCPRAGVATTNAIAEIVITNHLNYHDIFYAQLPIGLFTGVRLTALNHARHICSALEGWQPADTLAERSADIGALVEYAFTQGERTAWNEYAATLPQQMTLQEFRDWLWADTDDQKMLVLQSVYNRLAEPMPAVAALPPRVRIMSMHGAKGLSARAVFVPGLEEDIFPAQWRLPYPGLILEAARLLYVSITRARAACIASYSRRRVFRGLPMATTPSRFATYTGGPFVDRNQGLQPNEIQNILNDISQL